MHGQQNIKNDDKLRRLSLRNMHRRYVTFSALVPNAFLNAMFLRASLCQGTDFHFLLLLPPKPNQTKPNTSDYKGRGQIPVLPTKSRGEMRLRVTISFFFWKTPVGAETRASLNTTGVRRSSWEGLRQRGAPSSS